MRVLDEEELLVAEAVLRNHLPKSHKVYGFVHSINRSKPSTLQVVVDTWPDFKVIICKPDPTNKQALKFPNKVSLFCMDEDVLRRLLAQENAIDWATNFRIGGMDVSLVPLVTRVASERQVNYRVFTSVRLMYLQDISHLVSPPLDRETEERITSLDLSHVEIVNNTWKFGGGEMGFRAVENLIGNFPSCCITDEKGQPVSWILVYDYCAMGLLYTLPEHRKKGYAKVLISTLAKKLHTLGFPVYCFIEEENLVSYEIFKRLGFTEDPSYRAAWYEFNF
ncbi:glycine N-acyltransferase-like protein 3 isoform 1-T3 [Synchiropus picturatus]